MVPGDTSIGNPPELPSQRNSQRVNNWTDMGLFGSAKRYFHKTQRKLLLVVVCTTLVWCMYTLKFTKKSGGSENIKTIREHMPDASEDHSTEFPKVVHAARDIHRLGFTTPVLVTFINDAYLPFAESWLCNTIPMDIHNHVLFITTDRNSSEKLERNWPNIRAVAVETGSHRTSGNQEYSRVGYVNLMVTRTRILRSILRAAIPILLFEVDCLWLKNPLVEIPKIAGDKHDLVVTAISDRPSQYGGGFILFHPTSKTLELWEELTRKTEALGVEIRGLAENKLISEGKNDQVFLSTLLTNRFGGVNFAVLPAKLFPDGKWYKMKEGDRNKTNPVIINNNWVIGNSEKISRAKEFKHWFLTEKGTCDVGLVNRVLLKGS